MRLIDAERLRALISTMYDPFPNICNVNVVLTAIDNAPTIEPEERHGYWIIRGGDMWCSECGYGDVTEFGEPEDYRYCPNCGARMGETGTSNGKGGADNG